MSYADVARKFDNIDKTVDNSVLLRDYYEKIRMILRVKLKVSIVS